MHLLGFAQSNLRALACAIVVGGTGLFSVVPAMAVTSEESAMERCDLEYVAPKIQDAMLALKATQYCRGQNFPFTEMEVLSRLDQLRCDTGASSMIDDLNGEFDKQYRLILIQDKTHTVCKHAATLHIK